MSEYVIDKKIVIKSDIYPTVEKTYEKLVFKGFNVVWGNVYGREVIIENNTVILGSLYSDKISVENGNLYVLGNITGREIKGKNLYVYGSITATELISIDESIIARNIFAPKIEINGSIILGLSIAHSRNKEVVLKTTASITKMIGTTGDLVFNEATILVPLIYVKGKIIPEGDMLLCSVKGFNELSSKIKRLVEKIKASKDPYIDGLNTLDLVSNIEVVYRIKASNLAVRGKKRFILLLGDEIIYSRSNILREYVDQLKSFLTGFTS